MRKKTQKKTPKHRFHFEIPNISVVIIEVLCSSQSTTE